VHTPGLLATRPPSSVEPVPADGDGGLAGLLELFAREEPPTGFPWALRSPGARLRPWTQEWSRRAAAWGAGPKGAWRAW
jgi:hypothetical protein